MVSSPWLYRHAEADLVARIVEQVDAGHSAPVRGGVRINDRPLPGWASRRLTIGRGYGRESGCPGRPRCGGCHARRLSIRWASPAAAGSSGSTPEWWVRTHRGRLRTSVAVAGRRPRRVAGGRRCRTGLDRGRPSARSRGRGRPGADRRRAEAATLRPSCHGAEVALHIEHHAIMSEDAGTHAQHVIPARRNSTGRTCRLPWSPNGRHRAAAGLSVDVPVEQGPAGWGRHDREHHGGRGARHGEPGPTATS